jgi:hypothetical protein
MHLWSVDLRRPFHIGYLERLTHSDPLPGEVEALVAVKAGLCDSCVHQNLIRTGRGSVFSMCLRSKTDARFPKYPRIPVERCPGYEPREVSESR